MIKLLFCWASQQGRELATSGTNKKNQICQSYSYVNRKVWYHQIWITNNLGSLVLILDWSCHYATGCFVAFLVIFLYLNMKKYPVVQLWSFFIVYPHFFVVYPCGQQWGYMEKSRHRALSLSTPFFSLSTPVDNSETTRTDF